MTTKEEKVVADMYAMVREMSKANNDFRNEMELKVKSIEGKVEQKHLPITLESDIVQAIRGAILKTFTDSLGGYQSPLQKYALNVVQKYQTSIESLFDDVVSEAIKTDEFRQRVREVLLHKIAKTMISGIDGSVDKTVNQMKQDTIFRSRLTLAVNGLVEEFLTNSK